MKYVSVRGQSPPVSFREAVLRGLAPDGSLYVPERIPPLPQSVLTDLKDSSLHSLACEVTAPFIEEISPEDLDQLIHKAWDFPIPLVQLEERIFLLELFHGPTLAFKDVGARFMAQVLSCFLEQEHHELSIIVATSGDTGSAVAHGFFNVPHISVYVLYPSGKISRLQEQQMTILGGNIRAIEVEGTFDDCQRLVKQALADEEIVKPRNLTTANSINLGRLIPQISYYVWGVAKLREQSEVGSKAPSQPGLRRSSAPEQSMVGSGTPSQPSEPGVNPIVVVPSGNFGNLTAGVYAKWMGAPIGRFVAATNLNDVVPEYLRSGVFTPRPSIQTFSNAMDVGNPSNLARLQALYRQSVERMRQDIQGYRVSDEKTLTEIRSTYERTGCILDPHTAVGVHAARAVLAGKPDGPPAIVMATAHPGKFPEVVERALGLKIPLPPPLEHALRQPKKSTPLPNEFDRLKSFLLDAS